MTKGSVKAYLFEATTGTQMAVTNDENGLNLPPRELGGWSFVKDVTLIPGANTLGPDPDEVIAALEKDGIDLFAMKMAVKTTP